MNTFQESGLRPDIIKAVEELGFEKPTPIQEETIPFILHSKQDLVALARASRHVNRAVAVMAGQHAHQVVVGDAGHGVTAGHHGAGASHPIASSISRIS